MIDPETLRKAQLIMLDMLIGFDAICKKHQLQYWLDSGTLLGAVRHQGFIPWDDDIDLSMPVEDYNKFLKIAKSELSSEIFLQTSQADKNFKFDYIKLRSNKASIVEFHEKDKQIKYHQGVFVDVFPMLAVRGAGQNKVFNDPLVHLRGDYRAAVLVLGVANQVIGDGATEYIAAIAAAAAVAARAPEAVA